MPRKDGHAALKEIKEDPELRQIPLIVLSKSRIKEDIFLCYDLDANSYLEKPVTFEALVDVLQTIDKYGFRSIEMAPDLHRNA